jgi:hypothetical protein
VHTERAQGKPQMKTTVKFMACTLLAAASLLFGLIVFFGPAQKILTSPEYQSEKVLKIFFELTPPPRISFQPSAAWLGFLLIGMAHATAFLLTDRPERARTRQALITGFVIWLLMATWFEYWILWNIMAEPVRLIALELLLWLVTCVLEGFVLVYACAAIDRMMPQN